MTSIPAKPLGHRRRAGRPLEVQVVSLDWKWLFIYPDQGIASVNHLVIPAGTPVHFSLTSASVMNAFFIPQLGSMIYTMNGMTTQLNLQADAPGTFLGLSSHYSGDGFSGMHFEVQALPAAEFAAWVAATPQQGPDPRCRELCRALQAEPEHGALHLRQRRARSVQADRLAAAAARAGPDAQSERIPADGAIACSAS